MSGLAIARRSPVSLRVPHGTQPPYPNRTINSALIGAALANDQTHEMRPSTRPPRKGMKSITTTAPLTSAVVNSVSRMSVSRR